jgi:hypothetical protein
MSEETGVNPFGREKRGSRIIVSAKEARTEDGVVFDSKHEMKVYKFLRDNFGRDTFELQPKFLLQESFRDTDNVLRREILYKGDFIFGPKRKAKDSPITSKHTVVDAKGMQDAVFKMKHKMFLYKYKQPLYLPRLVRDLEAIASVLESKGYKRLPQEKKTKKTRG